MCYYLNRGLLFSRFVIVAGSLGLAACGGSGDSALFNGNGRSTAGASGDAAAQGAAGSGGLASSGGNNGTGSSSKGGVSGSAGGSGATNDASLSTGGERAANGGTGNGGTRGSPDASAAGGRTSTGGRGSGGARAGSGGGQAAGGAANGGTGGAIAGDGGPIGQATPGVIECAGQPCTIAGTPTNVCCIAQLPPFPTACLPSFPGCVQAGIPYACDDAADCRVGNICCAGSQGSSCVKDCPNGTVQLCRTNSECRNGACKPDPQNPEYGSCQ